MEGADVLVDGDDRLHQRAEHVEVELLFGESGIPAVVPVRAVQSEA